MLSPFQDAICEDVLDVGASQEIERFGRTRTWSEEITVKRPENTLEWVVKA